MRSPIAALAIALAFAATAARAEGPHAADAARHAGEPDAFWTYAQWPVPMGEAATAPNLAVRVYGYLPYWQTIGSDFRWDLVSDLVVFAASLTSTGTVSNWHGWPNASLIAAAHAHGVRVHLAVTLFDGAGIHTLVSSATNTAAAAQTLAKAVGQNGGDGLNLDFEFVQSADRAAFVSFLQALKTELTKDAPGAEISIASPPSTGYQGYDFANIAKSARILVMGYDYHWSSVGTTGPVAPLTGGSYWGEVVSSDIDNLLKIVPANQLVLGVPYYGYDWPCSGPDPKATTTASGAAVLYNKAVVAAQADGRLWETNSETPWYRYTSSGVQHQVWYDDAQSLSLKYQFIRSRKLAGAMLWALGYDSGRTELWGAIETELGAPPVADAGSADAGHDGGSLDAGSDAGEADAGNGDAGAIDAGYPDAGVADAGPSDAGAWDPDAGVHGPPPDTDAGGGPEIFAATGCASSGAAWPAALLLLALAFGRRRRS